MGVISFVLINQDSFGGLVIFYGGKSLFLQSVSGPECYIFINLLSETNFILQYNVCCVLVQE